MQLLHNPNNWLAFQNVMANPRRGLNEATLNKIHDYANENKLSFWQAATQLTEASNLKKCRKFIDNIENWKKRCKGQTASFALNYILVNSGYKKSLNDTEKADIKQLLSKADDFDTISDFLDAIAYDANEPNISNETTVYLMTIHAAKGLEFDTVFLPAWEMGQFPHPAGDIAEERRLAYVAITRAKRRLFITSIIKPERRTADKGKQVEKSIFINEIDKDFRFRKRSKKASFSLLDNRSDITDRKKIMVGDTVSHNVDNGYGTIMKVQNDKIIVDFNVIGKKTVLKSEITKA